MLIQIILIFFILLVIWRLVLKFRKKEINVKEFLAWFFFWVVAGLIAAWPKFTDVAAQFFGVETGFNLLVALAILVVFYLIFRVFIKLEKTEKDITKIIEHIALEDVERKEKD